MPDDDSVSGSSLIAHRDARGVPIPTGLRIDCDDCAMQHTDRCRDCIVTFICNREPGDALVIDAEEARAVRLLSDAGLVPSLQLVRKTS